MYYISLYILLNKTELNTNVLKIKMKRFVNIIFYTLYYFYIFFKTFGYYKKYFSNYMLSVIPCPIFIYS